MFLILFDLHFLLMSYLALSYLIVSHLSLNVFCLFLVDRQAEAQVWVAVYVKDGGYDERFGHRW